MLYVAFPECELNILKFMLHNLNWYLLSDVRICFAYQIKKMIKYDINIKEGKAFGWAWAQIC